MFDVQKNHVVAEIQEDGQINYTELLKGSHEVSVSKEILEQEHTKVKKVVKSTNRQILGGLPRI